MLPPKTKPVEGRFLFRSSGVEGAYIVSVIFKKKVTHHTLSFQGDTFKLNKKTDLKVGTLEAVHEHLKSKQKPYWPLKLLQGVLCEVPEEEVPAEEEPEEEVKPEEEVEEEVAGSDDGNDGAAAAGAGAISGLKGKFETGKSADDGDEVAVDDGLEYYADFVQAAMSPWYHGPLPAAEAKSLILIEDEAADTDGRYLFADDPNDEDPGDGRVAAYLLYVAVGGEVQTNRVVKVITSEQLQIRGTGTGCSTLVDLAEYLKKDQPGWNTPLTVGVPGIRSLTAEEQEANEQVRKNRIQAAKDAADAKKKEEGVSHRRASMKKGDEIKAAIAAENAAIKEREAEVKEAVPEKVRRGSVKKAKASSDQVAQKQKMARAKERAERHHERQGMNLLGQADNLKTAGQKLVDKANKLFQELNLGEESTDSEAEADEPIQERKFSTVDQTQGAELGAQSGRGSPLTVNILKKVKADDVAAALFADPKEDGKYAIREVSAKKKGPSVLALDFFFSGRIESLALEKNHNGVYTIDSATTTGNITDKFSLVEVLEVLTNPDSPKYWDFCTLTRPIDYPLDKKSMKAAVKEYKAFVKEEKKAGRM